MNNKRRKRILKLIDSLIEIQSEIANICEEEHESYDNLPEGLQDSERGEIMYDIIDDLTDMDTDFDNIIDVLNDIVLR